MEASPAPPQTLYPVSSPFTPNDGSANRSEALVACGTPASAQSQPEESEESARKKHFTTLRQVVCFKEMEMGELSETCGLGAAIKAMAESEVNPIINEDVSIFKSFEDAFVAVQACAASIGCLLVKNGALAGNKKPCEPVMLPFNPDESFTSVKTGKLTWPQLTWKLRCDRMHSLRFEGERNRSGHCSQSGTKRPRAVSKGIQQQKNVQVRTCSDKYFDDLKWECGVVDFTTPVVPTACLTVTLLNIILHVYLCLCTV